MDEKQNHYAQLAQDWVRTSPEVVDLLQDHTLEEVVDIELAELDMLKDEDDAMDGIYFQDLAETEEGVNALREELRKIQGGDRSNVRPK